LASLEFFPMAITALACWPTASATAPNNMAGGLPPQLLLLNGDLNRDRSVTISDFIDLAANSIGRHPLSKGDLNYDGIVHHLRLHRFWPPTSTNRSAHHRPLRRRPRPPPNFSKPPIRSNSRPNVIARDGRRITRAPPQFLFRRP